MNRLQTGRIDIGTQSRFLATDSSTETSTTKGNQRKLQVSNPCKDRAWQQDSWCNQLHFLFLPPALTGRSDSVCHTKSPEPATSASGHCSIWSCDNLRIILGGTVDTGNTVRAGRDNNTHRRERARQSETERDTRETGARHTRDTRHPTFEASSHAC